MRVLHIIKSLGRGGAETLLPEMLRLHDRQAFEFHYIYFLPWKDQMVEAIEQNGGKVTCISARNNAMLLLKYRKVIKYIIENKIDLIHCHLPWAGILGRLIHWLNGIPVIYTEHNKQERYHVITRMLNKFTFNFQSIAIAVSDDVAQSIRSNISVKIPIKTVLNGVNTKLFVRDRLQGARVREELGIDKRAFVVGTVAVFRFQKRLKEWLEVFSEAARQRQDMYGIIVGDGPLKDEIVAHRKLLGLEDRVFMPGLKTDVKPWLSAMDVYLMTSEFEGLPIAMLEAMSMECCICTTDAGGIKEVIRDAKDGWIVKSNEWKQLSARLILAADSSWEIFGAAARRRVEDSFSLSNMVMQIEDLYRNIGINK